MTITYEEKGATLQPKTAASEVHADSSASSNELETGVVQREEDKLHRTFTSRQIHVVSLGGQIGAGLFISSGLMLRNGGPGNLLLAFLVVCSCVWAILQTVSEMTISFPVSGNYVDYADRFVDPALSFCAGFSMWLGWTAIIAAEAVFFATVVSYWAGDTVHPAVWYTIFLVLMIAIFCVPVTIFAWFEYFTAILKVIALFTFLVTGLCLVLGAGPSGQVHDGSTWRHGLAFYNGFKGFGSCVLLAVVSIGDNTFTGFVAGEAKNPRYAVAHAAFLIPIRVTVFYSLSMLFIGLIIPATNPRLFGGSGVTASPFVIAIEEAGIKGLADFMNVVILCAVSSIGAESLFIASRMIRSMAAQGLIPARLANVDEAGRPRWAVAITSVTAVLLTYINLSAGGIEVFNWLVQIASTGYFMVWIVIAITSFGFRRALKAQNDPLFTETYSWKCAIWPFPPVWLLICCSLYIGCSFYLALFPIDVPTISVKFFFQYMFGLILIIVTGIGYKLIFRTKMRDPRYVDLRTGRRTLGPDEIRKLDWYYGLPAWRKFLKFVQLW